MKNGNRLLDLVLVIAIAVVGMVLLLTDVTGGITGAIVAGLLVLVLPGYAITAALFDGGAWGFVERLTLTMGLSLAISALAGFLLNWMPWGIQGRSWAVLLGSITIIIGGVALVRRSHNLESSDWIIRGLAIQTYIGLTIRQGAMISLALLIIAGATIVNRAGALQLQREARFTQLWMVRDNDAEKHVVHLGIRNLEGEQTKYRLQLVAQGRVVQEWPSIEIQPGESWKILQDLPADLKRGGIRAELYRPQDWREPYRWVILRGE